MADSEPTAPAEIVEYDEMRLKHLEFVEMAVIYAAACCRILYEFGKENSGPLLPSVQAVEDAVMAVLGPIWEKYNYVPLEILRFIDHKVDEYGHELERHMPSLVKQVSSHARAMVTELQRAGSADTLVAITRATYETCEPVAKELYSRYGPVAKDMYVRYEPVAEEYAAATWRHLNQLPLFPEVAHMVVPAAAYWAERYNEKVCHVAERGYAAASYIPLIPIDKITEIFEKAESSGAGVSVVGDTLAVAQ